MRARVYTSSAYTLFRFTCVRARAHKHSVTQRVLVVIIRPPKNLPWDRVNMAPPANHTCGPYAGACRSWSDYTAPGTATGNATGTQKSSRAVERACLSGSDHHFAELRTCHTSYGLSDAFRGATDKFKNHYMLHAHPGNLCVTMLRDPWARIVSGWCVIGWCE